MADTQSQVTLRTRKFLRNALLGRKQMVVWVFITMQPSLYETTFVANILMIREKATCFIPTVQMCLKKISVQNWQKPTKWTKTKCLSSASEPNTVEERAQGSRWFTTLMRHSRSSSPIIGLWDMGLRQRLRSRADSNVCTPSSIGPQVVTFFWGAQRADFVVLPRHYAGKQRKNRAKTVRGTAKTKGGVKDKAKKK